MIKNAPLKKQIASVLEDAKLIGNEYVAERVNEYGYKCTYRFPKNSKEFLLKRAAQIQKKPSYNKFKKWQGGNDTQILILFLEKNKDTLQILYDIHYLMKSHGYDAQKATKILFKNKQELPTHFYHELKQKEYDKIPNYYVCIDFYSKRIEIEYLINQILPILPKSHLEGIEIFYLTQEKKLAV